MTYTTTTNYAFRKPDNTDDFDAWGTNLNLSLDDIDGTIKVIDDIVAAFGASNIMNLTTQSSVVTNTYNYSANVASDFVHVHQDGLGTVVTINLTSTLASNKAVRKALILTLAGGAAATFTAGSGITSLTTDIGSGGASIATQGRNVFEVYVWNTDGVSTRAIVKRIGVTTAGT